MFFWGFFWAFMEFRVLWVLYNCETPLDNVYGYRLKQERAKPREATV